MARKRIVELISNRRARLISMEKRKKSLKKSAHDLATLCGVEIGLVIVSDQDSEVWPNMNTVHKLLPLQQDERSRRYYGVLDYFKEKREEVEGEMKKMRESKYSTKEFERFSHDQLRELDCFLKAKIGAVRETINSRRALASSRNPEFVEEEQILGCHYINPCLSTQFFMNPYLQESGFYCEGQSKNPYLNMNSEFAMNPYLEESEVIQQHHHPYLEEQHQHQNEMVMNSRGASSSQSCIFNFHQSCQDNYGHLLKDQDQNWCGRQTEMMMMMENFEPLPDEELMLQNLQNWQDLISFP